MTARRPAHRIRRALLAMAVIAPLAMLVAAPADAVGEPVLIDDFLGAAPATRTVTPQPVPGASTTAPGTFSESGGLATMTMNGNGNGRGGMQLDYALGNLDLTSGGSNTQFFIEFQSIQRLPVQQISDPAALISIQATDTNGVTGTYGTSIQNTGEQNIVLNFSCVNGPPCFSPQIDFSHVASMQLLILYPQNHDSVGSLTVVLDTLRTTPTGGVAPPAPTPSVTTPATNVSAPAGTSINFTVAFAANGAPAPVTHNPPSTEGLREQDVTIRGTAAGRQTIDVTGGPSTYTVTLGPLTSSGTVGIDIPAGVVTDGWGSDNVASSGTPTVNYTLTIPPTLPAATPPILTVGTAVSYQFPSTGTPTPNISLSSGTLPAGLTLAANGTLSGTPAAGSGGSYPITLRATNTAGTITNSYVLTVREAPAFTNAATTTFTVSQAGSFDVDFEGVPNAALTASGAPAWLDVIDNGDGTGSLEGTPPAGSGGVETFDLIATNVVDADTQAFTLVINEAPNVSAPAAVDVTLGAPVTIPVTSPGYPTPTLSITGSLPPGLVFTDAGDGTGAIEGTPTTSAGSPFGFTIAASNGIGADATQDVEITVLEGVAFTTGDQASFRVGQADTFAIDAVGNPAPTISLTGVLPDGLTFTTGPGGTEMGGTPAAGSGGTYAVELTASNGVGDPATQTLMIEVEELPEILGPTDVTVIEGEPLDVEYEVRGFPVPTLQLAGNVPVGLSLATKAKASATLHVTGTPTTPGTYVFTVQAQSSLGQTSHQIELTVSEKASGGGGNGGGGNGGGGNGGGGNGGGTNGEGGTGGGSNPGTQPSGTAGLPGAGGPPAYLALLALGLITTGTLVIVAARPRRTSLRSLD